MVTEILVLMRDSLLCVQCSVLDEVQYIVAEYGTQAQIAKFLQMHGEIVFKAVRKPTNSI